MTAGRLLVIVLVGAAVMTAQRSTGAHTVAEDVEDAVTEAALSRTERARELGGRLGAWVIGPGVRSVSADTHRLLGDLEPAMRKAKPRDQKRARDISARIIQLDSAAHRSLAAGEPVAAFRYVVRAKGLIPAARQTVAEESAFR
jgi:hypothetical protein